MKVSNHIKVTQTIVEVFKTNVKSKQLAAKVVSDLNRLYPDALVNFDLEDCDNILRIEAHHSIDILGVLNYGKLNNIKISLIED